MLRYCPIRCPYAHFASQSLKLKDVSLLTKPGPGRRNGGRGFGRGRSRSVEFKVQKRLEKVPLFFFEGGCSLSIRNL